VRRRSKDPRQGQNVGLGQGQGQGAGAGAGARGRSRGRGRVRCRGRTRDRGRSRARLGGRGLAPGRQPWTSTGSRREAKEVAEGKIRGRGTRRAHASSWTAGGAVLSRAGGAGAAAGGGGGARGGAPAGLRGGDTDWYAVLQLPPLTSDEGLIRGVPQSSPSSCTRTRPGRRGRGRLQAPLRSPRVPLRPLQTKAP